MPDQKQTMQQLQDQLATYQRRIADLEDAEARYQILFEGAGDAILIVDPSTDEIVDANANAARRLGYEREQLLGQPITDIEVQGEKVETEEDFRYESIASGVIIHECQYRRQDGSLWPTEVSISFIKMDNRTLQLNVVRDITERKEVEQQRLAVAVERKRVDILADFINNVSHEFKTPLSVINTSLYLLDKKLAGSEEHDRVALINEQVMYINHLIDAMLTMSQLDSRIDVPFRRFDLNEIVREVLSVGRPLAEDKGLHVSAHLSETPLLIVGAKDDLYLALYHLVDNAISFTPEDGSISVTTSQDDDMALVTIIDTGIGISDKDLPRIFERFFRADQARTERRVGLGLSMAKKVITVHSGRIEVESTLGQGTRFNVWLPIASSDDHANS